MTVTYKESINEKLRDIDIKLQNLEINDEEKVSLNKQKNKYRKQLEEDLEGDTKENNENEYDTEIDTEIDTDIDTEEEIEYESIYFKYWFDNCSTIDDVLTGIEALKCKFEQWKVEGHVLSQRVNNGYCFIDKIYKE